MADHGDENTPSAEIQGINADVESSDIPIVNNTSRSPKELEGYNLEDAYCHDANNSWSSEEVDDDIISPDAYCNASRSSEQFEDVCNVDDDFTFPFMSEISEEMMFSRFSVKDVMIMIFGFSLRYNLSHEARSALVAMVKMFAGKKFETLSTSNYHFSKWFSPPDEVVKYNFFCPTCNIILIKSKKCDFKKTEGKCPTCEKVYTLSSNSPHQFITIDIEYQLKTLLKNPNIENLLLSDISKKSSSAQCSLINDVYDGELYKVSENLQSKCVFKLTCNFNTDGAPIFQSSKSSMWPLLLIVNELPPEVRFKTLLLAAFWIGKQEPKSAFMNMYMSTFSKQIQVLCDTGFNWRRTDNNTIVCIKLTPMCAVVDSVARPIIQNRFQFNAYMGCSWCYINGYFACGAIRYPLQSDEPSLRSHNSHLEDVKQTQIQVKRIRGVKGESEMANLPCFDLVWGFPVDYMHGVLLGVTRQFWESWVTPGKPYYLTVQARTEINIRLLSVHPTHEIHRLPRSITEKAKWKASEWRSWLLFYSLPCLQGILPSEAILHFALLVKSVYTLLQTNISTTNLNVCEYDLMKFVGQCNILYGTEAMTFNVHSLLHLVQSVRKSGPLWATSAFPFENGIFQLKRQISGPKGVAQQVSKGFVQVNNFKSSLKYYTTNELCMHYCSNLFSYRQLSYLLKVNDNLSFPGHGKHIEDINSVMPCINYDSNLTAKIFNRCLYKGVMYHSTEYKRANKTIDTVVKVTSGKFVEIITFILLSNGQCFMQLVELKMCSDPLFDVPHILKLKEKLDTTVFASIECIDKKCLLIELTTNSFLCTFPNTIEIQ